MTEPIKQEIINNIFENGDKLITGPVLQTVLIDMVDDVNVKDQEILSKTGSWDDAATQIPNLATKAELTEAKDGLQANITNLSESVARDLENVDSAGYATETWVESQGYLKEHQDISNLATKGELNSVSESIQTDISNLATKTELNDTKNNLQGNITNLSESVARDIANVSVPEGVATEAWVQSQDYASKSYVDNAVSSVDLTGYATETWVENQGYLKEHQDISGLATKVEVTNLSESVARDLTGYATETWVESQGYLKEHQDISNLATKTELNDTKNNIQSDMLILSESMAKTIDDYTAGLITEIQNQDYASKTYVNEAVAGINLSDYATKSELTSVSESVQTDITNLSESVASSVVWKKGTGEDSIVQKLTGANETNTPTASGTGAIAIGTATTASGNNSHAEGQTTVASGLASHAEGYNTIASAHCSHAEGGDTKASGSYSHAEGIYTEALGQASHTEGYRTTASKEGSHAEGESTIASGSYSHAEGGYTLTSNQYEHAQGQYNHNSTNQIFSVGAGEKIGETVTRRNAVSILEVPNSETQVVTASFFVQNVGGYDGTNPTPGTNDLATVISNVSSIWKKGEGQDSIVPVTSDQGYFKPSATGKSAIATGESTNASGEYSHAEGSSTKASGSWSHAEGGNTKASGSYSHAEGGGTKAEGEGSHAEGQGTVASGSYSHAEGGNTKTSGDASHAEGLATVASGRFSHAEGYNATASGDVSHAEGRSTTTLGAYSHAEGQNTIASGYISHAEGVYASASGDYSHVEGDHTNASGQGSHAEGGGTTASGMYSHAEGDNTVASGSNSHAEGSHTNASGLASHAEGYFTVASNDYEHAQGRYNYTSSNQIFSIGAGERIVANEGTETETVTETRRNAISVLAVPNADTKINTASVFVQNVGGYDGTNPTPGTNDLATVISGLSSGGSSETLWKKGTGTDSIVQVIADGTNLPTATGNRAIATGLQTTASGDYSHAEEYLTKALGEASHAEGGITKASGSYSHAEGAGTTALGLASHAEGGYTIASNQCEHAQGRYNYTSSNQIFSIGAGNNDFDRRNAVSVLEVSNNDSYTSSFFVQNIGGYDGTNPLPGTNDLATVINGMSSGGGESGDYLPLTGGTLTGDLQVNSSMGVGTVPQGTHCLAVGNSSTNTQGSNYALAVGENCQVNWAYGGVSLGRENVVDAAFGLATGFRCRTTMMAGYAGGCRSTASANFAFAAGFGAEATRVGQVVLGAYNELDPSGSDESTGSYAVILANGKSDTWHQDYPGNITRSNGLAIKWDGGIDIKYQNSTITLQDKLNEIEAKISSGGTGTSTETWTFTLEDGSIVTKNIVMA